MPLYDFHCQECERDFEANVSLKDKEAGVKPPCPNCQSQKVQQVFRPLGYLPKQGGSGSCGSSGFG